MTNCVFFWRALAARGLPLRLQKCQEWKDMKFLMLSFGACFCQRPKTRPMRSQQRRPLAQDATGQRGPTVGGAQSLAVPPQRSRSWPNRLLVERPPSSGPPGSSFGSLIKKTPMLGIRNFISFHFWHFWSRRGNPLDARDRQRKKGSPLLHM